MPHSFLSLSCLKHPQDERFDQQKGPSIEELVAMEGVDNLGYMGWQVDQAADPEKVQCCNVLCVL